MLDMALMPWKKKLFRRLDVGRWREVSDRGAE
jgi:hypothetical protein